jgi:hypothetical protein
MVGVIVRDEKRIDSCWWNTQLGEPYRHTSPRIEQEPLVANLDQRRWPESFWPSRWRACAQ